MANKPKPIPEGYHTITPFLSIKGAAAALDFYQKAFGAKEIFRFAMPDGTIAHAEMLIGNSHIMLSDDGDVPGMPNFKSPAAAGKTTVGMCLYVEDVDALAKQAEAAGAKVLRAVETQFYGDRTGTFEDPFGHIWTIATHVEDVSHEELERRAREAH